MLEFQLFLQKIILFSEGLAATTSLIFLKRTKDKQWKYFSYYLITVFLCESIAKWGDAIIKFDHKIFYNFFVIPLEFLFFYWLYTVKSLGKHKLFYLFSALYLLSFIPSELFFKGDKRIYSLNYTFGCLLLLILVFMEYYKQINSDNILTFHKNKMFYINLGVTLFYIGTLPFWTFFSLLSMYKTIWNWYFIYFAISCIIMYILFSLSFIWGKQNS